MHIHQPFLHVELSSLTCERHRPGMALGTGLSQGGWVSSGASGRLWAAGLLGKEAWFISSPTQKASNRLLLGFSSCTVCWVPSSIGVNEGQGVSHRNSQFQLNGELTGAPHGSVAPCLSPASRREATWAAVDEPKTPGGFSITR